MNAALLQLVTDIYGVGMGEEIANRIERLMADWRGRLPEFSGASAGATAGATADADGVTGIEGVGGLSVMICYGDQFRGADHPSLHYLLQFLRDDLEGVVDGVHILPFSPYSSDDGFSVIDYRRINPDLGSWKDIVAIGERFRLMADLVLNHCSVESDWFQALLQDRAPWRDWFITVEPDVDLSMVFRPRALPLLHPFQTTGGERLVWTTFSADQVDLNWANPDLLLNMLDLALFYISKGVRIIRLDAIAYLWKEIGTPCLHHPKTHKMVRLMRTILDQCAPGTIIITETNVPHPENISYFGDGTDEAHAVYNFSLPPLTLDAFLRGNAGHLTAWARTLKPPSPQTAFFNFLASHDGIGVVPAKGLLSDAELANMVATVERRGGRISYKSTPDGDIPYELNVNWLSAITEEAWPVELRARAFLTSQAIMLCLAGVPGIYVHNLIGSINWQEGVRQTGANRSINREKLDYLSLSAELRRPGSLRNVIFEGYKRLLRARSGDDAFIPTAEQHVLDLGPQLFAILRHNRRSGSRLLCVHNVSPHTARFMVPIPGEDRRIDLITGGALDLSQGDLSIEPYGMLWLKI